MKKILVIEDEKLLLENIEDILSFLENFEVITAENGRIGLELAEKYEPDLIICDIMMPELDGYDVLRGLRNNFKTAMIPLIFLTAKADRLELRKGMELGADDYLTKPFTPNELLKAIAIRLKKKEVMEARYQKELTELRQNIRLAIPQEIKTPITGIISSTDFLLGSLETLEPLLMRQMLELIRSSSERLWRLTQNFILYTQLEAMSQDKERVKELRNRQISSAKETIAKVAEEKASQVNRQRDLKLELEEAAVKIGKDSLVKLVEELVDNSLKFSQPETPISICSTIENNNFILTISDRGQGMNPEEIEKIGPYMQFNRPIREQQGVGLGLAICQRLIKLHQGKLSINSIPKQKTTVTVSLPIE